MLEDLDDPVIEVLQMFGHRVSHRHYSSRTSSVRADIVASAWRDIAKTCLLEGLREPWKPLGPHSRDLDKRLSRMIHHYGFQDPPQWHEKSVPLGFVMVAVAQSNREAFEQCMLDILVIVLFFCLRYCGYNKTNSHRRTTQLRFQDMQFHDANDVVPTEAAADVFLSALAITMSLGIKKHCVRG